MVLNYFIDESGNTGDALNTGNDFDFCGQPVFSLACLGVDDLAKFNDFIFCLKSKYRLQGQELKSTRIYKNKPNFIIDLVDYLDKQQIPIFIEVVDKKYYISANLINCHVMPPNFSTPETQQSQIVRNHCADFIYENAPRSVFDKFIKACKFPADDTLHDSFKEMLAFANNYRPINKLSDFLLRNIEESIDDYKKLKSRDRNFAYSRFIPVPDDSKRNKSIWMLPNLTSFTNIYARINLYLNGNISKAKIFHDEQAHFDEIISTNKTLMEKLNAENVVSIKTAKYNFTEKASLTFAKSHEYGALQAADLLAGMAMRYVQEKLEGAESKPEIRRAYDGILRMSNPNHGLGINMLTTYKLHRDLCY